MMTRANKYGTKIEVEKYHCGSCANYEFEDEDKKNKCRHYDSYYYMNDSWNSYWTESSDVSESPSGCYLTTACCEYKGLPDNCEVLELLRVFRDSVLDRTIIGHSLKMQYYETSPKLLTKLENRTDKNTILAWLYEETLKVVELIKGGYEKEAISQYIINALEFEEKLNS